MMRKIGLAVMLMGLFAVFALCGCTSQEEALPEEDVDYEIALVTDDGLVMDGGHSEVAWNALVEFGGTNGVSHKYYKASEPTEDAFIETIKTAINHGAGIVIIDNSSMESAAMKMQDEYPEISFVMTDSEPYDEDGNLKVDGNTVNVSFDSAQAGFLAGYASVIEGYTALGVAGQDESNEVRDFGYGYIKGADCAATDMGISVSMDYRYCEDSSERDAVYKMAKNMYDNGAEVIFAAGADIQEAVIEAAEACDGKVIGSITDQSAKSDKVITSAIYNIRDALETVLKNYIDKDFPGGEVLEYSAANDGIGLELRNNRLKQLNQDQYDYIYEALAEGEIKIKTDKADSPEDLKLNKVIFSQED